MFNHLAGSSKENHGPSWYATPEDCLGVTHLSGEDHFSVHDSTSIGSVQVSEQKIEVLETNGEIGDVADINYDGVLVCMPFTSRKMCVRFVGADGQFWMRLSRAQEITSLIRVSSMFIHFSWLAITFNVCIYIQGILTDPDVHDLSGNSTVLAPQYDCVSLQKFLLRGADRRAVEQGQPLFSSIRELSAEEPPHGWEQQDGTLVPCRCLSSKCLKVRQVCHTRRLDYHAGEVLCWTQFHTNF